MKSLTLALIAVAVLAGPAAADQWSSRKLGGTTYTQGRDGSGQSWNGSSRQLGGTGYGTYRSDSGRTVHCTSRKLGSQTTTSCR